MMTSNDLRGWRAAQRLTQEEAANALGYSRRGYQDVEARPGEIGLTLCLAVAGYEAAMMPRIVARSLHGQTLGDLSDEQNIQQADHELRRATTDAALADWARRWGECAVRRCRDLVGKDDEAADDLREAEADAFRAETKLAEVKLAAEVLIKALDGADKQSAAVDNAIGALENAL